MAISSKIDSVYQSLSDQSRVNKTIWISSIEDPKEAISFAREMDVRGVFLPSIVEINTSEKGSLSLAIKLTDNLHTLSNKEIPSIPAAAAFLDTELFTPYANHLKEQIAKSGFDLVIIPTQDTVSNLYAVGKQLNELHPSFFRYDNRYSFNPVLKRKDYEELVENKIGIILDKDLFPVYEKVLKKEKKHNHGINPALEDYANWILELPSQQTHLSPVVQHQLWRQIIVPFQKNNQALPLNSDVVGIWVENESSILKNSISHYFPEVLNLKYDQIPEGIPLIIDARSNPMLAAEYAYNFQQHNPIIWISSFGQAINVNAMSYLLCHDLNPRLDHILTEMIYGSEGISGLPGNEMPNFLSAYHSDPVNSQFKLGYTSPEWVGFKTSILDSIDVLAEEMIRQHGTPGGQVLVAREGKVVLSKAYGYLTYDSLIRVSENTIYDLASLTKVNSTLMAAMKLVDEDRLHLDSTLGHYLPEYIGTNKEKIRIRNLLSHQAGLPSYIPFWKRSLSGDFMDVFYYKSEEAMVTDSRSYGYEPDPILVDSLQSWIINSKVSNKTEPGYKYSDIGFMILHQVIERITGQSIESFVSEQIYNPLNMPNTAFNPLNKGFEIYEIAPTEYDHHFREEQVWGNVHDRNAAIFGGVAGHAGLFSNARDLAKLMQMVLHDGNYGGKEYFSPNTIHEFNRTQFDGNRRGLGWDKPGERNPNITALASPSSFGHTGFTGTMVWADPEQDLIFIFLSNRIFPNAENKNLIRLDTRKRMQDLVYRSLASK